MFRRRPLIQPGSGLRFDGGTVFASMPAGTVVGQVTAPGMVSPTFSIISANPALAIDSATGRVTLVGAAPSAPQLITAVARAAGSFSTAVEGLLTVSVFPAALAGIYDLVAGALDNFWEPGNATFTTQSGGTISGIVDQGNLKVDLTQPDTTLQPAALAGAMATGHTALRPTLTAGKRNRVRNIAAPNWTQGVEFLGVGSTDGSMSVSVIQGASFLETPASTFPVGSAFLLGVVWDEARLTFYNGVTPVYSVAQACRAPGAIFAALKAASSNGHSGRVLRLGPTPVSPSTGAGTTTTTYATTGICALGDQGDADGATVTQSFTWDGSIGSVMRINGRIAL